MAETATAGESVARTREASSRFMSERKFNRIARLLEAGWSVQAAIEKLAIPSSTYYAWLDRNPGFKDVVQRAQEAGNDLVLDQAQLIADKATVATVPVDRLRADVRIRKVQARSARTAQAAAMAAVQVNINAAERPIDPKDPRESWRGKPLADWSAAERIEAQRRLPFEVACWAKALVDDLGFPAEVAEVGAQYGAAIARIVRGEADAAPAAALPARVVVPTPDPVREPFIDITPVPPAETPEAPTELDNALAVSEKYANLHEEVESRRQAGQRGQRDGFPQVIVGHRPRTGRR